MCKYFWAFLVGEVSHILESVCVKTQQLWAVLVREVGYTLEGVCVKTEPLWADLVKKSVILLRACV